MRFAVMARHAIALVAVVIVAATIPARGACTPPAWNYSILASLPATAPAFQPRSTPATPFNAAVWGNQCRPVPTNSWWTNMMMPGADYPVLAAPYLVAAPSSGLRAMYPWPLTAYPTYLASPPIYYTWTISAAEGLSNRLPLQYDPLTVTLGWTSTSVTTARPARYRLPRRRGTLVAGSMTVPLARGSPYLTALYTTLTPSLTVGTGAITSPRPGTYQGSAFAVTLSTGQQWRLYFARSVSVQVTTTGLQLTAKYTGGLRLALVPTAGALTGLDAGADVIPVKGAVNAAVRSSTTVQYTLQWSVQSLRSTTAAAGALLMLALPHHLDAGVAGAAAVSGLQGSFKGLLGGYTGLRGATWTITETLPAANWQAPRAPAASKITTLRAALSAEQDLVANAPDPYFGSSQAAAIGHQALVADLLQEATIAAKLRTSLKGALNKFLDTTSASPRLVYDSTWGGVVSAASLVNPGADFGNGVYNDHHFHYGYLLYAAAALGAKDPAWLAEKKPALLDIVRDFANPRQGDTYFPFARNMDFYAGHSWASGIGGGAWDVQNQESSSEAVHAYYSLALLGSAMGDVALANWGRLLMAVEMRAAQKYYQVPSTSTVYPEPFKSNKVVGILWATKADYSTFFGTNVEFIHCIQHIPYRPHTEQLLPAAWINETLPLLLPAFSRVSPPIPSGFGAFVRMAQAIVDPGAAWQALQTWQWQWDGPHAAVTRTTALWWAATRAGAI